MRLSTLPRVRLAHLPTPLQEMPNLTKALKGPRLFIKRDDLTGLALGGNKTRKLEYLMAEALAHRAEVIVTGAGFQSNWCTQAAAAARKLGMRAILIKTGPKDGYDPEEYDGNHLLHFLSGAEIKVARPENFERVQDETMEELKKKGHRPFLLAATGSTPPGAAGYINCILELLSQSVEIGVGFDYLVHTSGSGGTQAGLVIGSKTFSPNLKVIASTSGSRKRAEATENVSNIIQQSLKFLGSEVKISKDDVIIYDQYAGAGYGVMTEGKAEAVKMVAEMEGIYLDPVYTASAMACLIDLCRKGFFKASDTVVFLHSGGAAALFPYKVPIKDYGLKKSPTWTVPPWSPTD